MPDTTSSARKGTSTAVQTGPTSSVKRVDKKLRLHPDLVERAKYWAPRHGMSENEYMVFALENQIARENGDYDLPQLEIQRLNQLIDELVALSSNITNLEAVTVSGFDSLLGLTRGDSYLQDNEDGELDEAVGDGGDFDAGGDGFLGVGEPDSDVVDDGFGGMWGA